MWPWRRQSPFEHLNLPQRVFISHSYKDSATRERLLKLLPSNIEPFIFPPITVPPEQMVSDKLLDAIRACDGLIYLEDGASAESFWVALERDYALRLGKPVFSLTPTTMALAQDTSSALELHVYAMYFPHNQERVRSILTFLSDKRFFQVRDAGYLIPLVGAGDDMQIDADFWNISRGAGCLLIFWSHHERTGLLGRRDPESSMLATLGIVGHRTHHEAHPAVIAYLDNERLYLPPEDLPEEISIRGDKDRSETQRIDDLIVRLCWLIYRNTRQNQLS